MKAIVIGILIMILLCFFDFLYFQTNSRPIRLFTDNFLIPKLNYQGLTPVVFSEIITGDILNATTSRDQVSIEVSGIIPENTQKFVVNRKDLENTLLVIFPQTFDKPTTFNDLIVEIRKGSLISKKIFLEFNYQFNDSSTSRRAKSLLIYE